MHSDTCPACNGKGSTPSGRSDSSGNIVWRECGLCRGTGTYRPGSR